MKDQLFIILVRLRLGVLKEDLADSFLFLNKLAQIFS